MSTKKIIILVVIVLVLTGITAGTILHSQAGITKELLEIVSGAEALK